MQPSRPSRIGAGGRRFPRQHLILFRAGEDGPRAVPRFEVFLLLQALGGTSDECLRDSSPKPRHSRKGISRSEAPLTTAVVTHDFHGDATPPAPGPLARHAQIGEAPVATRRFSASPSDESTLPAQEKPSQTLCRPRCGEPADGRKQSKTAGTSKYQPTDHGVRG